MTVGFPSFRFPVSGPARRSAALILFGVRLTTMASPATSSDALFHLGSGSYHAGDYVRAAQAFEQAASLEPASGTLRNLGNAEWKCGKPGLAVLSWERALWLDPFDHAAQTNLQFARKTAQLESPELTWYEVVSTWLPVNWWAWIASISFWLAVALVLLPGILRLRKVTWHQAGAALGFAVFLLSAPAHWGVDTRSHLGFVLEKDTPLRLTPTTDAQVITRLPSGEPARIEKARGPYVLVRTSRTSGWLLRDQVGLIAQPVHLTRPAPAK